MKILLIDPPFERLLGMKSEWYPLGLTYIASYIESKGFDKVTIYHGEHGSDTSYESILNYSKKFVKNKNIYNSDHPIWDEIRNTIINIMPDVIGISVLTPKVPSMQRIIKICNEIDPNIKIVLGGHHPTINAEEMLLHNNADFVVRGEGEETFYELLLALKTGETEIYEIKGLSYKIKNEIIHNEKREYIRNLDKLPSPGLDKIIKYKSYTPTQFSMIMTSRGCPYNCGFCASKNLWGKKVRYRSIDNVIKEINELKEKYSVKFFTIMDDAFTIKKERVVQFCNELIDRKINITWACLTRVDIITDDLIALMKKAGCAKVDIGIESGNVRILKMIGKNITLNKIRNAVSILRRNHMFWSGFFMFGFPTETEKEIHDTLNLLKELKPNWVNISVFTPYPGTELFYPSINSGLINNPPDYTLYSHQNINERSTDTLNKEEFKRLAEFIFDEVHKYNSSINSLIKRAFTRKYHKNPILLFHDLKKAYTWISK